MNVSGLCIRKNHEKLKTGVPNKEKYLHESPGCVQKKTLRGTPNHVEDNRKRQGRTRDQNRGSKADEGENNRCVMKIAKQKMQKRRLGILSIRKSDVH